MKQREPIPVQNEEGRKEKIEKSGKGGKRKTVFTVILILLFAVLFTGWIGIRILSRIRTDKPGTDSSVENTDVSDVSVRADLRPAVSGSDGKEEPGKTEISGEESEVLYPGLEDLYAGPADPETSGPTAVIIPRGPSEDGTSPEKAEYSVGEPVVTGPDGTTGETEKKETDASVSETSADAGTYVRADPDLTVSETEKENPFLNGEETGVREVEGGGFYGSDPPGSGKHF